MGANPTSSAEDEVWYMYIMYLTIDGIDKAEEVAFLKDDVWLKGDVAKDHTTDTACMTWTGAIKTSRNRWAVETYAKLSMLDALCSIEHDKHKADRQAAYTDVYVLETDEYLCRVHIDSQYSLVV